MKTDSFKDFILDQLRGLGELSARSMFSSWGLYSNGKFFGLVSGGRLYFKTNINTRGKYEQEGMKPFAPNRKQVLKNYYEVPVGVIESPEELIEWAREAAGLNSQSV